MNFLYGLHGKTFVLSFHNVRLCEFILMWDHSCGSIIAQLDTFVLVT